MTIKAYCYNYAENIIYCYSKNLFIDKQSDIFALYLNNWSSKEFSKNYLDFIFYFDNKIIAYKILKKINKTLIESSIEKDLASYY
jgi:hypothetical protein